jgi:hypothetical protein
VSEITEPETVKNPKNAAQKPESVKIQDPPKPEMNKPDVTKPEVKKSEVKKPEIKKPETKKKDPKKPEITEEKPAVTKKLESAKKPDTPKKDSKKPNSAKSSATNTPTKKRGLELVRTGSGSSNRTASSNERSPRAGSDGKGGKRSRR